MLNALAVFAALIVLWQLILWVFHVPPFMLPSPWAVGRAVGARYPSLLNSLAITAEESAGGLIASIVVGVIIALFFAQSRWVRKMLYPYTLLLQTVPIIAIAPLILMWMGAGDPAVTLIAFIISLAPIIANTTQGLISVEENLVDLFLMHNATRGQVLFKLRLAQRSAVALRRHSHCQRNRRDRRDYGRTLCRVQPRGRRRPGLFDFVRFIAIADRLSVCAGAGRDCAGLQFSFSW